MLCTRGFESHPRRGTPPTGNLLVQSLAWPAPSRHSLFCPAGSNTRLPLHRCSRWPNLLPLAGDLPCSSVRRARPHTPVQERGTVPRCSPSPPASQLRLLQEAKHQTVGREGQQEAGRADRAATWAHPEPGLRFLPCCCLAANLFFSAPCTGAPSCPGEPEASLGQRCVSPSHPRVLEVLFLRMAWLLGVGSSLPCLQQHSQRRFLGRGEGERLQGEEERGKKPPAGRCLAAEFPAVWRRGKARVSQSVSVLRRTWEMCCASLAGAFPAPTPSFRR